MISCSSLAVYTMLYEVHVELESTFSTHEWLFVYMYITARWSQMLQCMCLFSPHSDSPSESKKPPATDNVQAEEPLKVTATGVC